MEETTKPVKSDEIIIPSSFVLEDDLLKAYELMEFTNETIFLTGRAGTGKSTLLNYFRKNTRKNFIVLAPTGLAALQVGGSTIHSFFGFPLRTMVPDDPDLKKWGKAHPKSRILQKADTIIIDEVSMVRVDIMNSIDATLKLNLNNDLPFGGKQLIMIGDVFQLPPVHSKEDVQYMEEDEMYNPYFFSSTAFLNALPKIVELKKIYRQQDDHFIYLLNRIRQGIATSDDFDLLNERTQATPDKKDFVITITAVNAIAESINQHNLLMLKNQSIKFKAIVEGNFPEKLFPTSWVLTLKEGAQVMMVKNDIKGRWVNGSVGVVELIREQEIYIRFEDGSVHQVERELWENKSYEWDRSAKTITTSIHGTFLQYPIKLAWAITIHKSQGLTFEKVIIDMGRGAFAHGQLYVALSRCKNLEGIFLKNKITLKDVIVDEVVEDFARRYRIG